MAPPSRRRPSSPPRRRRGGPAGAWRAAAAIALLVAGLAVVAWLALRGRQAPAPAPPSAAALILQAAERAGCPADRVTVRDDGGRLTVTVHAPAGLAVRPLLLALEAVAHNSGGRLEPVPVAEAGGYGLAALGGRVQGQPVRILVLRETPPPTRAPARVAGPAPARPLLAIVLDDAGNSLDPLDRLSQLPAAIAVAVLPNAARSAEVGRVLGAQGREVLLHMPMQAAGGNGTGLGEGAVEVGLSSAEITARLERALEAVPGARGLNNHMGSRATADGDAMAAVMDVLRARGLYFLDSRTTPDTVAAATARGRGVPCLERDVFLDVVPEPDAVRAALAQAVEHAKETGRAVAIGHVIAATLDVLLSERDGLLRQVELVSPLRLARPGVPPAHPPTATAASSSSTR